jgi:hypothetical protein
VADARADRAETEKERTDRNLAELLGELRVALPGIQVLFAFLLVVPFNQRFEELSSFEEAVYFVTLLCTAVASILLIAPTVHHRVQFRQHQRKRIVEVGNRLVVVGRGFLAVAMTGAILLITHFVLGGLATGLLTGAVAAVFAVVWYAMPLVRR